MKWQHGTNRLEACFNGMAFSKVRIERFVENLSSILLRF